MTAGSGPDKKDGTTPPMFLLGSNNGMMQMVYWCDFEEPQLDEEYPEYFEEAHRAWAIQEQFRRNASKYTKLIVDGTQTLDVKYVDEILLNPDGEKLFPGELHGMPKIPSLGARFTLQGEPKMNIDEVPGNIVVTDSYLASHKPLKVESATIDEEVPLPAAVIKKMEEKYGMKAEQSKKVYIIGDRYTYGVMQFEGEYKNSARKKRDPNVMSSLTAIKSIPIPSKGGMTRNSAPRGMPTTVANIFPATLRQHLKALKE